MKKSLFASLVAAPVLSFSSLAFAAEPASMPLVLSAADMDRVTAAGGSCNGSSNNTSQSQNNHSVNVGVNALNGTTVAVGGDATSIGSGQYQGNNVQWR